MMPVEVEVRNSSNEALEIALRKFKKKMETSKILDEFNKRQFYVKPSLAKRERRKMRAKYG